MSTIITPLNSPTKAKTTVEKRINRNNDGGTMEWNKTYGGSESDIGYFVTQTTDGGYIIVGETYSYGAGMWDVFLIKTDENGTALWSKTYRGTNNDWGRCVVQTSDGGYIITSQVEIHSGPGDVWLIKTDENGNKIWDKTYGGTGWDEGYCVTQTTDGGYIIGGKTTSFSAGGSDFWLIKISNSENSGLVNSSSDNDVAMYIALGVSIVLAAWPIFRS